MPNVCPLCTKRVNDWQMANGKATVMYGKLCHNSCIMGEKDAQNQITLLRVPEENVRGAS